MAQKYYWLKLQNDFFKRHDIRIIEEMPNGKDYILFYLKLLVESVTHNGSLRFSETIPYNEEMLATITNTNVDIVRSAVKIFSELDLMERFDDGTLYLQEVEKMTGCETEWAKKKQEYRLKKQDNKNEMQGHLEDNVRQEIEKEIELDIELDIEKDKIIVSDKPTRSPKFVIPLLEEVTEYCNKRKNDVDAEKFIAFYNSKNWYVGKNKMVDWKSAVITWEKRNNENQEKKVKQLD